VLALISGFPFSIKQKLSLAKSSMLYTYITYNLSANKKIFGIRPLSDAGISYLGHYI
jgi:hypothetical protein